MMLQHQVQLQTIKLSTFISTTAKPNIILNIHYIATEVFPQQYNRNGTCTVPKPNIMHEPTLSNVSNLTLSRFLKVLFQKQPK